MSMFSECLSAIKDKRALTSAKMAEIIGVECSVMYRWVNGERIPNNCEKVRVMCEKLKLPQVDAEKLMDSYELTVLGEERYNTYRSIKSLFDLLQKRKDEYSVSLQEMKFLEVSTSGTLPSKLTLNNNIELMQCMQNLFEYIATLDNKRLYIKLQRNISDVNMLIKMLLAKVDKCYVEEIMCIPNDVDNIPLYYLELLKTSVEIIAQKNEVKVYYGNNFGNLMGTADNYIISDNFILQFDDDLRFGMMTTEPDIIQFHMNNYEVLKKSCYALYNVSEDPVQYIQRTFEMRVLDVYGIEYMPCMGCVLPEESLEEFLYDFPGKELFIKTVVDIYKKIVYGEESSDVGHKGAVTFFYKDGLLQFMETGRFEVFPYEIYKALSVEARCKVLRNAIDALKTGRITQYMVREEYALECKGIHIEYDNYVNKLYIETHFDNKTVEVLGIEEENICSQFKEFFLYLKDSGNVYSREETITYMETILSYYEEKNTYD